MYKRQALSSLAIILKIFAGMKRKQKTRRSTDMSEPIKNRYDFVILFEDVYKRQP